MRVFKPRSRRTIAIIAVVAALVNLWLAADSGAGPVRAIGSSLFMAAFMAGAFTWMNRWSRADPAPVDERVRAAAPPKGGCASQTTSQRARGRAVRALSALFPRWNRRP